MKASPEGRRYALLARALKHLLDARARLNDAHWLSEAQRLTPLIEQLQEETMRLWAKIESTS